MQQRIRHGGDHHGPMWVPVDASESRSLWCACGSTTPRNRTTPQAKTFQENNNIARFGLQKQLMT